MSAAEQKQIDAIVGWSVKVIMVLVGFSMSTLYYSMAGDVSSMRGDQQDIKVSIGVMQTDIRSAKEERSRMEKDIREIRLQVENIKFSK